MTNKNTNKLSVIIPTVQKCVDILNQLISTLVKDEVVDEIIIINNLPQKKLEFSDDKVYVITPNENLYVNPAWNLGIKKAKNDNIVLINDDVLLCENFCSMVINSPIYKNTKTGLIGATNMPLKNMFPGGNYSIPTIDKNSSLNFKILENTFNTGDWGITIFGKRQNFYEIPDDLKIFFGDNYLLFQNKINGYFNYYIINAPILHVHSLSSFSFEFKEVINSDTLKHKKYFNNSQTPKKEIVENKKFCLSDIFSFVNKFITKFRIF